MKQLIKISNKQTVDALELYKFLGYDQSQWARWYRKNIIKNPFAIENDDYIGFDLMSNGNLTKNFTLSLDFAKRLAMMARTEQGEKVRKYFIACEEQLVKLKEAAMFQSQLTHAKQQLSIAPGGTYDHQNFIGDFDEYDIDIHARRFIKENITRWLILEFIPDTVFFLEYKTYCKLKGIEKPLKPAYMKFLLTSYCPKIRVSLTACTRAGVKGKTFIKID